MSRTYELLRQLEKEMEHPSFSHRQGMPLEKRIEVMQKSFADAILELLEGVDGAMLPLQSEGNLW